MVPLAQAVETSTASTPRQKASTMIRLQRPSAAQQPSQKQTVHWLIAPEKALQPILARLRACRCRTYAVSKMKRQSLRTDTRTRADSAPMSSSNAVFVVTRCSHVESYCLFEIPFTYDGPCVLGSKGVLWQHDECVASHLSQSQCQCTHISCKPSECNMHGVARA